MALKLKVTLNLVGGGQLTTDIEQADGGARAQSNCLRRITQQYRPACPNQSLCCIGGITDSTNMHGQDWTLPSIG